MKNGAKTTLYVALGLVVLAAAVSAAIDTPFVLPALDAVGRAFELFSAWAEDAGAAGVLLTVILYAVGVVVAFPATVMTIAVTMLYGYWAALVAWTGAVMGLAVSYFLARRFLRGHMAWFCSRYPLTRGVVQAMEERGGWIVFLMRQSPVIPFSAQNYLYGMLGVPPAAYVVASAVGIVPGTLARVFIIGSAGGAYAGGASEEEMLLNLVLVGLGIAATVLVMVLVGRVVRRELQRQGVG